MHRKVHLRKPPAIIARSLCSSVLLSSVISLFCSSVLLSSIISFFCLLSSASSVLLSSYICLFCSSVEKTHRFCQYFLYSLYLRLISNRSPPKFMSRPYSVCVAVPSAITSIILPPDIRCKASAFGVGTCGYVLCASEC